MSLLETIATFLLAHRYGGIFAANLLTSVYVPFPNALLLLVAGALARGGYLDPLLAFLASFAGTLLGDLSFYLLVRRFGTGLGRRLESRRVYRVVERYLRAYPRQTIVASRPIGLSTTAATALAGMLPLPARTFVTAAALGDALCVLVYGGAGYAAETVWHAAGLSTVVGTIITVFAAFYVLGLVSLFAIRERARR